MTRGQTVNRNTTLKKTVETRKAKKLNKKKESIVHNEM